MKRVPTLAAVAGLVFDLAGPVSPASATQPDEAAPVIDAGLLSAPQFRRVGPALMSGCFDGIGVEAQDLGVPGGRLHHVTDRQD